ncbi:MAG TPA: hypothetical protein VFB31_01130 [Pseudolabrys sp.]|nr:hypothetical protein [Pseudolabrys sp.]
MWASLSAYISIAINAVAAHWAPIVIDFILTAILVRPLCNFLLYGWARKFEEIDNSLTDEAKQTYFKVYLGQELAADKVDGAFSELYQRWFGRRRFITPVVLVFAVATIENFVLAQTLIQLVSPNPKLDTASAAIAGAYTFVAWDFFGRVQRRNLTAADIMRGALRLAIAVPLGFAFSALSEAFAVFLAFAIGVFPLETISTMLRRLVNDKLKLEIGANTAPDQVATLSGVDRSIADRIEEADITTIPQLAWCDPIQLTMRTNLNFDYVVDITSQALAWVYFGDKLPTLRPYGLRGAFELFVLADDLKSADADAKGKAKAVLPVAAQAIGISVEGFSYAIEQIAGDPATEFLYDAS